MNQIMKKLTGMVIMATLIIIIPLIALATNEKIQVVNTEKNEYILYVENMENTEFKYAISNNKNATGIELQYINSEKDDLGNSVVLIDSTSYETLKEGDIYLWIKNDEKEIISAQQIELTKSFEKNKMADVENTTKKIKTEIVTDLDEEDRTDENGVHITVSVGGIKITDSKEANYLYQIVPAEGEYKTLMDTITETINKEYDNMTMSEKIQTANEFYDLFTNLSNKAEWKNVENMTIRQPKNAAQDSKYVVFIKKTNGSETTVDVQFLTCKVQETPKYEKEKIVVQETTKLPITGESMILFVILAVIVVALIIVFIRMKKLKNKNG